MLMEEEFKDLFFSFKSLESPPLHLFQLLNGLMVQESDSWLRTEPQFALLNANSCF